LISVFKIRESTSSRRPDWSGASSRVKTSALLAVILFATAWQSVHYHARFLIHSGESLVANDTQTPEAYSENDSGNHDECLICQLKRQISSVVIFHAPRVVLSLEIKPVRRAVFFYSKVYPSTENSPSGGRAPPASFPS